MDEKFFVGTKLIAKSDPSRVETLGPSTGSRQVTARIYYPTSQNQGKKIDGGKKFSGILFEDAREVENETFPLIVYNHDYEDVVDSNHNLCYELASQGYVVLSVGHPFEDAEAFTESGTKIKQDKNLKKHMTHTSVPANLALMKLRMSNGKYSVLYKKFVDFQNKYGSFMVDRVEQWALDTKFIVEEVKVRYPNLIDLERGIGIIGHGFGGNVAYYICQNYKGYSCGVNIDGLLYGHYDDLIMSKPFYQISSGTNEALITRSLIVTEAPVYYSVFGKTQHNGFIDPKATGQFELYKMVNEFFKKYLKQPSLEIDLVNNADVRTIMANKSKTF